MIIDDNNRIMLGGGAILRAGPGRERPGSKSQPLLIKILQNSIALERRGGSGAAGDRKNIDFSLKTFRKVSILYPGSLGTVLGAQGRKNNRRKHWICAKLTKTAGHQMASTIKNLRRKPLILRGKSHRSIEDFMGVNSPILRPILEGPRGQNLYCQRTDLGDTEIQPGWATSQPPDPTLPSRAHHKDYVSRTTSSN